MNIGPLQSRQIASVDDDVNGWRARSTLVVTQMGTKEKSCNCISSPSFLHFPPHLEKLRFVGLGETHSIFFPLSFLSLTK